MVIKLSESLVLGLPLRVCSGNPISTKREQLCPPPLILFQTTPCSFAYKTRATMSAPHLSLSLRCTPFLMFQQDNHHHCFLVFKAINDATPAVTILHNLAHYHTLVGNPTLFNGNWYLSSNLQIGGHQIPVDLPDHILPWEIRSKFTFLIKSKEKLKTILSLKNSSQRSLMPILKILGPSLHSAQFGSQTSTLHSY
jgi:hypothetical protein